MNSNEIDLMLFGEKTCTACGHGFPANTEHFSPDNAAVDGLTSQCKVCRNAAGRAAYKRDPGKYAEKDRHYRERKAARA